MSNNELNLDEMMELAGELDDQNEVSTGGGFDNTPEEGDTVGRFISYVEIGKHDGGEFKGKKKPDSDKVRLTFELLGPSNWIEWEQDGVTRKVGQTVSVLLKKSNSEKSSYVKLFKKMQYGRTEKNHMAKMLGEAFIIGIFHNKVKKDGQDRTYVNLHKDGEFGIRAPFVVDPISKNKQFYDVPEATQSLTLFLWAKPMQSMWDKLFIDGTSEKKDAEGNVTNVSKNWLQEMILSAKNFAGSPLQALLAGVANLPTNEQQAQEQKEAEKPPVAQEQVKQEEQPAAPKEEPVKQAPADPLAALGFK